MAYHADCAGLSHRGFTKAEIDAAGFPAHTRRMAKKSAAKVEQASSLSPKSKKNRPIDMTPLGHMATHPIVWAADENHSGQSKVESCQYP
jgi:hypothetical protein